MKTTLRSKYLAVALAVFASLLSSCQTQARRYFSGESCTVGAPEYYDPLWVQLAACACDVVNPKVAELFSLPPRNDLLVEISEDLYPSEGVLASTTRGGERTVIRLGRMCFASLTALNTIIGHELAHVYMYEDFYELPPYVVEEGMALYVGYSLLPRDGLAQHLRESEEKGAKLTPDLLELTSQETRELPKGEQEKVVAAALGFVADVGFERLLGLLREGTLTREELLALVENGTALGLEHASE